MWGYYLVLQEFFVYGLRNPTLTYHLEIYIMAKITTKTETNTSNGFLQLVLIKESQFWGYITISERKFADTTDLTKLNAMLAPTGLHAEHKKEDTVSAEL